jgi:small-conductance mechanosensitive channel
VRTYEKEETMDVLIGTLWLIAIFAIVDGGAIFMIWFPRQRLTVREASHCFFALALIKSAVLAIFVGMPYLAGGVIRHLDGTDVQIFAWIFIDFAIGALLLSEARSQAAARRSTPSRK